MATQNEIKNFIASTYNVEFNENTAVINFNVGEGRSQRVLVGVFDLVLSAFSPFAKVGQISDADALSISSAVTPIAKVDEFYGHAAMSPLDNLQPDEVTTLIELVTQFADESEKELGLGDDF